MRWEVVRWERGGGVARYASYRIARGHRHLTSRYLPTHLPIYLSTYLPRVVTGFI